MSALQPSNPEQTFGVLFIGFALSMTGYGFTFFQTYVYFSGYPSDHWALKLFLSCVPHLVKTEAKDRLKAAISVAAFFLGIGMITTMFNTPLFAHLATNRALISLAFRFITLASLVAFIALVQSSKRSPDLLDEVYLYLFPRGLVGTAIWFGCILLFLIQPHNVYWVPMYLTAVKVSVNAMLTTLNLRESFRGKGLNEEDPPPPTRTGYNQSSNTHRGTTVSNMFNHTTNTKVIHISRTAEHDRVIDDTISKRVYSSDDDPIVTFRSVDMKL
ncbi:hypothetical protein C8F04DRAFT_1266458 [Mycena alexandri]|uniref:DUF6534 domain-containing protein n=1 Tax=Mycena alexandri TaxID=1745969 RepID=A0AAD6WX31_9AGAR|nr:hypothetical protein C8F04DRAFT_1284626 [Mycena alexandri]KAJ7027860.1 hypothetical protein C8F04DRAFT_1266458 [Mycena alexandri]